MLHVTSEKSESGKSCARPSALVAGDAVSDPGPSNHIWSEAEPAFWEAKSAHQRGGDWLRHSRALDWLKPPSNSDRAITDFGARCGPIAFAAITGLSADDSLRFFPESQFRPWTSRIDMIRAFRESGRSYSRKSKVWPAAGLCLVQFTGPWSRHNFPAAALAHTHWVAVLGEYIYDINWEGWLPRQNWEEIVLEELINAKPFADGWCVLASYEIPIDSTLVGMISFKQQEVDETPAAGDRK